MCLFHTKYLNDASLRSRDMCRSEFIHHDSILILCINGNSFWNCRCSCCFIQVRTVFIKPVHPTLLLGHLHLILGCHNYNSVLLGFHLYLPSYALAGLLDPQSGHFSLACICFLHLIYSHIHSINRGLGVLQWPDGVTGWFHVEWLGGDYLADFYTTSASKWEICQWILPCCPPYLRNQSNWVAELWLSLRVSSQQKVTKNTTLTLKQLNHGFWCGEVSRTDKKHTPTEANKSKRDSPITSQFTMTNTTLRIQLTLKLSYTKKTKKNLTKHIY